MIIYVDIDETICVSPEDRNYSMAIPITENIKKINKLYDEKNTIVYWTARGTVSGIDWSGVTKDQFIEWGVKYHDIKFGKPNYDLFIDDKSKNGRTRRNKIFKIIQSSTWSCDDGITRIPFKWNGHCSNS